MEIVKKTKVIDQYLEKYEIPSIITDVKKYPFEIHYYKKGEHICSYGKPFSYFYFLLNGKAKVYSLLANGKSLLYTFFQGFDMIGDIEMAMGTKFKTNVETISDVTCLAIRIEGYEKELMNDLRFMQYMSRHLARKLEYCSRASSFNLLYPLENRLASYLVITAEENLFAENLTEVSELLGTSYRHLLRILSNFSKSGYVKKTSEGYLLQDLATLKRLGADIYL